jgi:hypothetical protein
MDENRADTPEQVIGFAPKGGPSSHGTLVEEAEKPSLQSSKRLLTYRMKTATVP